MLPLCQTFSKKVYDLKCKCFRRHGFTWVLCAQADPFLVTAAVNNIIPTTETEPSSPVSSAENGGEIARVWYSSIKALWHIGRMFCDLKQVRRRCSPQDRMKGKKRPQDKTNLSQIKVPTRTSVKIKRGCFGAFLLWRKENHFLQLFMTHYTYLKTTGIFGG